MPLKKKIEDDSLVDQLVSLIHDAIIEGEYEPGAHIGVKKIADRYGVSMIPVREALARLLPSRLVNVENNRGYFVADKPTPEEFRQFVEARELFETSVMDLGFDKAGVEDIKKLRGLNDKMRKVAVSSGKHRMVKWSRLNVEFHQTLVDLAQNSFLSNQYSDLSYGYMHLQLVQSFPREFTSLELLVEQHNQMIDAHEKGDRKTFFEVLSGHIQNVLIVDED
ncbi:MAG: GntR family transcriptional regulator [Pseudomonadota bacterium]